MNESSRSSKAKTNVSLNNGLDIDHLHKVYQDKVWGRQSGKSVAYATFILGVLEVNPQCNYYHITGPSEAFLNHFQMQFKRVVEIMEIPYRLIRRDSWVIDGACVKFFSYANIVEKCRGVDCIIFDVNDVHRSFFDPCLYDIETIAHHINHMKQLARLNPV